MLFSHPVSCCRQKSVLCFSFYSLEIDSSRLLILFFSFFFHRHYSPAITLPKQWFLPTVFMKKNNFSCVKIQSDNDHHSTLNLPVTTTIQNLFFFSFHGTKRPSAFRSNLRRMRIQTARAGTHVLREAHVVSGDR